jgi:large subunit ribosomal protein L3
MKFILGKKIGMTEIFAEDGKRMPVTLVEAGPCQVAQIKTKENDGYSAVGLGFDAIPAKRVKKGQAKCPYYYIKECRTDGEEIGLKAGDKVEAVTFFKEGDIVKVSGISKGKGTQGAVKRYGFGGRQSCTHGQKHEMRNVGSVGMGGASIRKGRKMPGRMGSDRVTVTNLKIVKIDAAKNLMAIEGAIPGNKGTLLEIRG